MKSKLSKFDQLYNKIIKESKYVYMNDLDLDEIYSSAEFEQDYPPIRILKNTSNDKVTYYVAYYDDTPIIPVDIFAATGIKDEFKAAEQVVKEISDYMKTNGTIFGETLEALGLV